MKPNKPEPPSVVIPERVALALIIGAVVVFLVLNGVAPEAIAGALRFLGK